MFLLQITYHLTGDCLIVHVPQVLSILLRMLLKNGFDFHFDNEFSLKYACIHNQVEIVRYLIQKGSDVKWI